MDEKLADFSSPVHTSLLQRELLAGVPHIIMLALLMLGIFTVYMAKMYFFAPVIIGLYIAARILTKKDPFLLDVILISLLQQDEYIP